MQERKIKHSLPGFIKAGLQTGALLSVLNIVWYLFSTQLLFIHAPENINIGSVVLICFVVTLLASVSFYFVFPMIKKPVLVYRSVVFILALISLFVAFGGTMSKDTQFPDRFYVLTFPMHVFAGIITAYFLPKFLKKDLGAMFRQTA